MRLYGVLLSAADCERLVELLLQVGRADDLDLVVRIVQGLRTGAEALALSPAERTVLLAVLDDPPDGLSGLREALALDHLYRM